MTERNDAENMANELVDNEMSLDRAQNFMSMLMGYPIGNIIEDRTYKEGVLSALRKFKKEKTFPKIVC